jgi:hypothetical protein
MTAKLSYLFVHDLECTEKEKNSITSWYHGIVLLQWIG